MPRVRGSHEAAAAAAAAAAAVRYGAPRTPPGVLRKSYRCHSMACLGRPGLELGDKIVMPQSAFKEVRALVVDMWDASNELIRGISLSLLRVH